MWQELVSYFADSGASSDCVTETFDANYLLTHDIADWLRARGLPNEQVNVFWPSDQEGASLELKDFLEHLDELWFPSSDDVIVESSTKRFMFEIDHEEQVKLLRWDAI